MFEGIEKGLKTCMFICFLLLLSVNVSALDASFKTFFSEPYHNQINIVLIANSTDDNVEPWEECRYGDVDPNRKIDIFDVLATLKILSGDEEASDASDVDRNGKTNIFDVLEILTLMRTDCHRSVHYLKYIWDFGDGTGFQHTTNYVIMHMFDEPGEYNVKLYVENSINEVDMFSRDFKILERNFRPVFADLEDEYEVYENDTLIIQLNATDQNNDILTYSASGLPEGATLDSETGVFEWTPNFYQGRQDYEITFIVEDGRGDKDEIEMLVDVENTIYRSKPNASPKAEPMEGYAPLEVSFTGNVDGGDGKLFYGWWIEEKQSGDQIFFTNEQNFTFIFENPGTYEIEFSVMDEDDDEDEGFFDIIVKEPLPTAYAYAEPNAGGVPLTVNFRGEAQDGVEPYNYSWDLGDGNNIEQKEFEYTYNDEGNYTVVLTVTDEKGNSDTDEINVMVNHNHAPVLEPISDIIILEDESEDYTFTVSATDEDGDTLTYNAENLPGDAEFSGQTFFWKEPNDGVYTHVRFIVEDGKGGRDVEDITITVREEFIGPTAEIKSAYPNPQKPAELDPKDTYYRFSNTITFRPRVTEGDAPIVKYVWHYGDGTNQTSSIQINTFRNYNETGDYTVTYEVTDANGKVGVSEPVIVKITDFPEFDSVDDITVDEGQKVSFTVSATDTHPVDGVLSYSALNLPEEATFVDNAFNWTTDDKTSKNSPYTITFIATDEKGAEDTIDVKIYVNEALNEPPTLEALDDVEVNEGGLIDFTLVGSDVNDDNIIYTYDTIPTGVSFDENTGEFHWETTLADAGDYEITFRAYDGYEYSAEQKVKIKVIDVYAEPQADFTYTSDYLKINYEGSVNGGEEPFTYSWDLGDESQDPEVINPDEYQYANPDTYTVTFTVTDGRGNSNSIQKEIIAADPCAQKTCDLTGCSGSYTGSKGFCDISQNGECDFAVKQLIDGSCGYSKPPPPPPPPPPPNQAPSATIDSPGSQSINTGQSLNFQASDSDSDGSIASRKWTFGGSGIPDSTDQDPGSKTFNNVGTFTVTYTVWDDDGASTSKSVTITVTIPPNQAPTLSGIPDKNINEDSGLNNNLVDLHSYHSDADDSAAASTFTIESQSASGTVNCVVDGNRYVDCTPALNQVGSSTIVARVTDGGGLWNEDTFIVTVDNVNDPISITGSSPSSPQTMAEGGSQAFSIDSISDDDVGDTVSYDWKIDGGATVGTGSSYTYNPGYADAGDRDIDVTVTDGGGATDTMHWDVTVTETRNIRLDNIQEYNVPVKGTATTFTVDVHNDHASATEDFTVKLKKDGVDTGDSANVAGLGAGSSQTISIDHTFASEGDYTIEAYVDALDGEDDSSDNSISRSTHVATFAELKSSIMLYLDINAPTPWNVSTPFDATLYFYNFNGKPITIPFQFVIPAPMALISGPATTQTITMTGQQTDITWEIDSSNTPGTYDLEAIIDGITFVTKSITVQVFASPIIGISQPALPPMLDINTPHTITSTVYNTGNETAYNIEVKLDILSEGLSSQEGLTKVINRVDIGASVNVSWDLIAAIAGPHEVYVSIVDYDYDTKPVTIESQPYQHVLNDPVSARPTSGSAPLTVQFKSQVVGTDPPYTYLWDFDDGGTSTEQNPKHIYVNPGEYEPILTVTDSMNVSVTSKLTITVKEDSKSYKKGREAVKISQLRFSDEYVRAGDFVEISLNFENLGSTMHNAKVTASILELGIRESTKTPKMGYKQSTNNKLILDIPKDTKPGEYDIRISISDDGVKKRVKHRPITIIE